jgi:hypothetical protein
MKGSPQTGANRDSDSHTEGQTETGHLRPTGVTLFVLWHLMTPDASDEEDDVWTMPKLRLTISWTLSSLRDLWGEPAAWRRGSLHKGR